MLVTSDVYTEAECVSDTGLIEKDQVGMLKEVQKVIAVGPSVRDYKPGDLVQIDFSKYARKHFTKDSTKADMPDEYYNEVINYEIPMFDINNETVLYVDSADVFFRIDDSEEIITEIVSPKKSKLVC